jgi:hypothetical protein
MLVTKYAIYLGAMRCLNMMHARLKSFRHRPYFSNADVSEYFIHQNALNEGSQQRGMSIVRVFHVEGKKLASNAFSLESGHIRTLQGLADLVQT